LSTGVAVAIGGGVAIYGGGLVVAMQRMTRTEMIRQRLQAVRFAEPEPAGNAWLTTLLRPIAWIGGVIARSGLLSRRSLEEVRHALKISGFTGASGLALFVGIKVVLFVGLPIVTLILPPILGISIPLPFISAAAAGVLGLLTPDYVINRRRSRYLKSLEHGLADGLDMMLICADAGLAIEASIERVSVEIAPAHPTVARELMLTVRDMQVNADRRAVLMALGTRTGLPSLQRMAAALVHAMNFGTPLSSALRTLASELRHEQLTKFEERAARLPVLLTMPMIIFILPAVFLIVAGPAMLGIFKAMGW
jgi:tight adherence protein C